MSAPKHRQKQDGNQRTIDKRLNELRVPFWKFHTPADRMIYVAGHFVWLECKDGALPPSARKLTDQEQDFFDRTPGGRRHVVRSADDAYTVVVMYLQNQTPREVDRALLEGK